MTPAELTLALQLAAQGLAYWQNFTTQAAAGLLTQTDLDAAAGKLDIDIAQLESDVTAQAATAP